MCLFPCFDVSGQSLNITLVEKPPENNPINGSKVYENLITAAGVIGGAFVTGFFLLRQRKGQQKDLLKLEYTQQKNRLELEYDISLRKKRTKAYNQLWALTSVELEPNYYTLDKLKTWKNELHDWYYEDGNGMLLSEHSQKLYHNFKDRLLENSITALEERGKRERLKNNSSTSATPVQSGIFATPVQSGIFATPVQSGTTGIFLEKGMVDELKNFLSGLRTSLTIDIGGREDPKISFKYGSLKIIESEMKTDDWSIQASPSKQQLFKVLYTGTKKIDLKDSDAYMIIKNIDNWKHIDLIKPVELPSVLNPDQHLEFIWPYKDNIDEIFRNAKPTGSNGLFESVYILVRIEINTTSETLSVVNTYEFKRKLKK
jgi:hypothetical protein